jgi:hypothetical protein
MIVTTRKMYMLARRKVMDVFRSDGLLLEACVCQHAEVSELSPHEAVGTYTSNNTEYNSYQECQSHEPSLAHNASE